MPGTGIVGDNNCEWDMPSGRTLYDVVRTMNQPTHGNCPSR